MICLVCRESRDHRSHTTRPIDEAVQEYKEKYEMHLETLRKKLQEILEFKSNEEQKAEELIFKTQIKREEIQSQFEELHQFLKQDQWILLLKLEEEKKATLKKIRDNVTQLKDQSSSLKKLILEIEEKCQQPVTELLKDAKVTLSRCQTVEFPGPEADSTEKGNCSHLSFLRQYFILKDVITKHRGKLTAELVNVTLDPETAYPYLIVSEDRKSVRDGGTRQNLPDNPQRFATFACILGV